MVRLCSFGAWQVSNDVMQVGTFRASAPRTCCKKYHHRLKHRTKTPTPNTSSCAIKPHE